MIRKKYHSILGDSKNFIPTRIISRDEDPIHNRKSTSYILPSKTELMVILDDRRDVWSFSPQCLYTKEYFHFFMRSEGGSEEVKLEAVKWESGGGSLIS